MQVRTGYRLVTDPNEIAEVFKAIVTRNNMSNLKTAITILTTIELALNQKGVPSKVATLLRIASDEAAILVQELPNTKNQLKAEAKATLAKKEKREDKEVKSTLK